MFATFSLRQKVGLFMGLALFFLVLVMPLPEGMSLPASRVAAVALLMACFWMAETVPIPATGILPIFLFPLLDVMPTADVTLSYGNQILFLFMGGFLIAVAMQKWNLHRRIALSVINKVGSSPNRLVLGFMLSTALLSMWISNTATCVMMTPVAIAVVEQTMRQRPEHLRAQPYNFGTALMLGIAYSSSAGGVSTLVGTPPNAILIGMIDTLYGYQISFVDWMKLGLPISICMLGIIWVFLTRIMYPMRDADEQNDQARLHIQQQLDEMGTMSGQEKKVALVFFLVAVCWILRGLFTPEWLNFVSDPAIAMCGAFLLFIIPAGEKQEGFILDWDTAKTIPWDIIILMGGGFALAAGFSGSGLTEWLANQLTVLQGVHFFVLIIVVVLFVTFLTEMTSNAATATLFIPVMGALAISMDLHPFALMVPAALGASFAFMLPVATPPNAIVFASRQITIAQMAKTGFVLNIIGALVVSTLSYLLLEQLQ
ncbi:MAG: SLC13/DASS family transporter [Gammaproteobacteria bacterium]|nr:SLC13/DASS family transporter [Gammaproteobacteria bacterium]